MSTPEFPEEMNQVDEANLADVRYKVYDTKTRSHVIVQSKDTAMQVAREKNETYYPEGEEPVKVYEI